ncbi:MAG: glycosyltransferase, partial [Acidimicrobiia bacterium]|nr:glycosyltransferase [Acidimicrobiia bacterium]
RAIQSALESEYRPIEIIVSDNASQDGTSDIVSELAREHAEVQHHRSDTTVPLAENWERAYNLSSGRYFKWGPHDNYYSPDFVGEAIAMLREDEHATVAYAHAVFATEKGIPFGVTDDAEPGVVASTPTKRVLKAMRAIRSYPAVREGVMPREVMERTIGIPNIEPMDRLRVAELAMMGNIRITSDPIIVIQIPEGRKDKDEWVYNDPDNASRRRLRLLRIARSFDASVDYFTDDRTLRLKLKAALTYSYLRRRVIKAIQRPLQDDQPMDQLRRFVNAVPPEIMPGASSRFASMSKSAS